MVARGHRLVVAAQHSQHRGLGEPRLWVVRLRREGPVQLLQRGLERMAALQNRGVEHECRGRYRRVIQPRCQGGFGVSEEPQVAGSAGARDIELRQRQRYIQALRVSLEPGRRRAPSPVVLRPKLPHRCAECTDAAAAAPVSASPDTIARSHPRDLEDGWRLRLLCHQFRIDADRGRGLARVGDSPTHRRSPRRRGRFGGLRLRIPSTIRSWSR